MPFSVFHDAIDRATTKNDGKNLRDQRRGNGHGLKLPGLVRFDFRKSCRRPETAEDHRDRSGRSMGGWVGGGRWRPGRRRTGRGVALPNEAALRCFRKLRCAPARRLACVSLPWRGGCSAGKRHRAPPAAAAEGGFEAGMTRRVGREGIRRPSSPSSSSFRAGSAGVGEGRPVAARRLGRDHDPVESTPAPSRQLIALFDTGS